MKEKVAVSLATILVLVIFFGVLAIFASPKLIFDDIHISEDFTDTNHPVPEVPTTVVFVGDIMLARTVELHMEAQGSEYPFLNIDEIVGDADILIGNFEGVVTKTHYETPPMTMRFSVKAEYLKLLKNQGFDVLSLANNHSSDYGAEALGYTRSLCKLYELTCIGSPFAPDAHSYHIVETNDVKVGLLALHTLFSNQDTKELYKALLYLNEHSDIQIAYIHWGTEYERTHANTQQMLAELLIDNGIDAVVGHHPHVVQNIQIYNGKPIFYSLGNFVFDQYFSADVTEGIALRLEILEDTAKYTVIPVESTTTRSQPRLMAEEGRKILLKRIFGTLTAGENIDDVRGEILVER